MKPSFTPSLIYRKQSRKMKALLLTLTLTPLVIYQLTLNATATDTTTWNSTNFAGGTKVNTEVKDGKVGLFAAQTTDTTIDDFSFGNKFSTTVLLENGDIEINQGYAYDTNSNPALQSNSTVDTFISGDFVYVSTRKGLHVIDTKGTIDPSDDTLAALYNSASTPSVGSDDINSAFLENGLLYVSTYSGGISVIDTKNTISQTDDTLVTTYALPGRGNMFLNNNLLYISTDAGMYVFDTKGTVDPGDDEQVILYSLSTTPPLVRNGVNDAFLDGNLLYISSGDLFVFDTKGTTDQSDDVLLARYNLSSAPALPGNGFDYVFSTFSSNQLIYTSTYNGLVVIDTHGTPSQSDDTIVATYNTASEPALPDDIVRQSFLSNGLLYISSDQGVVVIDTHGTAVQTDDTVVARYTNTTNPALVSARGILNSFLNSNILYTGSYNGLSVSTPGTFTPAGTYISSARSISTTPTTTITVNASTTAGQNIGLSYRTGNTDSVYFNDFNDGTTTEYLGDFYMWGSSFQTANESAGTIKISSPLPSTYNGIEYANLWLDTGYPDKYFTLGSIVTARVRINSTTRQRVQNNLEYMFNDDFWDYAEKSIPNNEWATLSFKASSINFSKVGFQLTWANGTWSPTDTFEIDWIKVTTPDSMGNWGSWVACPDQTCVLPNLGSAAWLQYKLDLSTNDTSNSPVVHSVSYNGPYQTTGTYTSATQTYAKPVDLVTFNAVTDTPPGTAIAFEYTTNGTTWTPVSPGQQLSREDIAADSFQWRATLSTTNAAYTPTITSVTLTTTPHKPTTSTSIPTQVKQLEDHGNPDAAAVLRAKYPELFDGTASDQQIQTKIVELLGEAIDKLRLLIKQRGK